MVAAPADAGALLSLFHGSPVCGSYILQGPLPTLRSALASKPKHDKVGVSLLGCDTVLESSPADLSLERSGLWGDGTLFPSVRQSLSSPPRVISVSCGVEGALLDLARETQQFLLNRCLSGDTRLRHVANPRHLLAVVGVAF
jgi:hypothetical protein